jgi:hypothetical protein
LKKDCAGQFNFFVNYAWYIVTLMDYSVSTIKVLKKNKNKNKNLLDVVSIFFESLADLWSIVHIRVLYK